MRKTYFFFLALLTAGNFAFSQSENFQNSGSDFSIDYEKFTLDNGLEVILHEDHSDPK